MLEQTGDPAYPRLVGAMITALDFERGFFILQNGMGHLRNIGAWETLWRAFAKKHGALARAAGPTLDEIIRRDGIVALRASIGEVGHRFFLALLLNIPSRRQILAMVERRYPGDPLATILGWAEEFVDTSNDGPCILDAMFPASLEIAEDEQPGVMLSALRYFIKGGALPDQLQELSAKAVASLRATFVASSWRALLSPTRSQRTRRPPVPSGAQ